MFTYTFYRAGRRHTLLPLAELPWQRDTLQSWRRVSPFLTRIIVHEALHHDPANFKAFVMRTLCLHAGLDHSSPQHAWEAYLDDHLVHEWNPTHALFAQPPTAVAVNVPVVAPVVTTAPTPTEWIEIAFVDSAGDPVANVGWTVELADARVMNGVTGRNGLFRISDGPPGNARLTYRPNGLPALKQLAPPGFHTVRQGQDIVSIAWAYGHADWNTVWDDAQNQAARDAHKSPMVLLPGTRLFIPEPDQPTSSYAMGQRHEVVIDPPLAKLDVAITWMSGDALADEPYSLSYVVNSEPVLEEDLRADGAGRIVHGGLPLSVTHVDVVFTERGFTRRLRLRHLDPVGTPDAPLVGGIASRLTSLGYPVQRTANDITTAIKHFQREVEGRDEPTGELDDATLDRLVSEYGA